MKNDFLAFMLFVCYVFVTGCNNGKSDPDPASKTTYSNNQRGPSPSPSNTDTLNVDSAEVYIANYGAYCAKYFSPMMATSPTQAFLVDSSDFVSVLGINSLGSVKQVRIYVGLKADPAKGDTNFHLFIVPIGQNGSDSIPQYTNQNGGYVYDLTTPCPPTCDKFSSLFMAFRDTSIVNIKWPAPSN